MIAFNAHLSVEAIQTELAVVGTGNFLMRLNADFGFPKLLSGFFRATGNKATRRFRPSAKTITLVRSVVIS